MKIENIGKNLKVLLDALQMEQGDLARRIGMTESTVSQIISGDRAPSLDTMVKILTIIPVPFERLVDDPDPKPRYDDGKPEITRKMIADLWDKNMVKAGNPRSSESKNFNDLVVGLTEGE